MVCHMKTDADRMIFLNLVQKRLNLYYNKENLFSIDSEGENKGTLVTIRIPAEEELYV